MIDYRLFTYHENILHVCQWKYEFHLYKIYDVPLNKNKTFVSLKWFNIKRICAFMCKMMQSLFLLIVKSKILIETTKTCTTKTHDSMVIIFFLFNKTVHDYYSQWY